MISCPEAVESLLWLTVTEWGEIISLGVFQYGPTFRGEITLCFSSKRAMRYIIQKQAPHSNVEAFEVKQKCLLFTFQKLAKIADGEY